MKNIIVAASLCAVACGGRPDVNITFNVEGDAPSPTTMESKKHDVANEESIEEAIEEAPEEQTRSTEAVEARDVIGNPLAGLIRPYEGRTTTTPATDDIPEVVVDEEEDPVIDDVPEVVVDEVVDKEEEAAEPTLPETTPAEEDPVIDDVPEVVDIPEETPALSCLFARQQELDIYTGMNSIAPASTGYDGSPKGFYVAGDSFTEIEIVTPPFEDAEPYLVPAMELQYWDLESMEGQFAFFAGQGTEFIGQGDPNNAFMAMVRWPEGTDGAYNHIQPYRSPELSSFYATGGRYLTAGSPPWGEEEPWQGLIRAVETDQGPRTFWVRAPVQDEDWSVQSSTFEGSGRFTAANDDLFIQPNPYDLRVQMSGSQLGMLVAAANGTTVRIWSEEPATSGSRDFGGVDVFDFFGTDDGMFAFVWYERATGRRYLSKMGLDAQHGMTESTALLPESVLRIAPFKDGFVAVASNADDPTSFWFQQYSADLDLVGSISFGADFEIYPLRTGNLAAVGEGLFAFTWTGVIGGERSNLIAFECE